MKKNQINWWVVTWIFISSITLLRFWYISRIPLSADEAYFWVCSRHLSLCYYDQPPMVPYLIFLSTKIGRNSELWVRFFSPLCIAITGIILYIFTKKIFKNEKFSFYSTILIFIIPGFSIAGLLAGVESPLILFYILSVYFLYKAIFEDRKYFWYIAGISFGFGLLTKYLILFIPLSLFIFLLLSHSYRKYLKTKYPYLFLLTGFLIFSPVIYWNAKNQWVNFSLNFLHRHSSPFHFLPDVKELGKFIASQIGIISPFLFFFLMYVLFQLIKSWKKDEKFLFLLSFSAVIFFFFFIYSLFIETPEPHWTGIGYLPLFISMPFVFSQNRKKINDFFIAGIIFSLIITILIHLIPFNIKLITKFNVKKKTEYEMYAFMMNWPKIVGKKVAEMKEKMGKDTFILCRGFALASYIEFYNPSQEQVYMVFQKGLLGHGYYYWQNLNSKIGKDAIFVDKGEETGFLKELKKLFKVVEKGGTVDIKFEGKKIKTFSLYRCYDFKGMEKEKPPIL